jgi:hypothetical protein
VNDSICKCGFSISGYFYTMCSSLYGNSSIVYCIVLFGFCSEKEVLVYGVKSVRMACMFVWLESKTRGISSTL